MNTKDIFDNVLLCTDAYKASHFKQLPPGTTGSRFYLAPRKQLRNSTEDEYVIFGLGYYIMRYLARPITQDDIAEAREIWDLMGVQGTAYPFPYAGFQKIIDTYDGYLPVKITGVPEGRARNDYNVPLVLVECLDPDLAWLPGFIETTMQRAVWYGSTVATVSRNVRKFLEGLYTEAVDEEQFWTLDSRLHDFGARGVSSGEGAALGGLAHLVNFNGTDTMEAVMLGKRMYDMPVAELAASIPAAEHSTVTSWGRGLDGEREALNNMITEFGNQPVFAFVSDSYDFKRCVRDLWGDPDVIARIREAGALAVVRPDSGDPREMVLFALENLAQSWGYTVNKKGYKVLNGINVIQGDGMVLETIKELYQAVMEAGFSPENVAVGMGGGLLQRHDRDSMSWSMKMYQIQDQDGWRDVVKNPVTQPGKKSWNPADGLDTSDFIVYYENGKMNPDLKDFRAIRRRARKFTAKPLKV